MKRAIIFTILILISQRLFADEKPTIDTLISVDLVSVSTIKQGLNLRNQPMAATIISADEIESRGISEIKEVSQIVPNLHIPDYGSRTTSSIYIRGLGARIDQPVMGLNIDNVPLLNKNAFDTEVSDIERIEVLRGPQSTLYGRNTMGGVMNIYTLSPFNYQGVKVGAEYGSGNSYKLRASLYSKHSDKLATAASIYYNSTDGFFENSYTGELCDWEHSAGARLRISYRKSDNLRIENTTAASTLEQGGYAYRLFDSDEVNYNQPSSYDRLLISNGTTVKYQGHNYSLASITSYQYLDDDMHLDNDFTEKDYFTLQQAIKEHSVTEDIVYRSEKDSPYNFLFGAFGFYKHQNMNAPVTFMEYGIDNLILSNANKYASPYSFVWDSDKFLLSSEFINNTFGAALYHESRYETEKWSFAAGIRLDYECATLAYHSYTDDSCTVLNGDGEFYMTKDVDIVMKDKISLNYLEILPRFSATYHIGTNRNQSTLYGSISKGYKAGGFNNQMFSDVLKEQVMYESFGIGSAPNTDEMITYKPEHSWNYEIGGHFESGNRKFTSDIALFYIDCQDQQLTVFPEGKTTTGRMMTNAGQSRSYGVELSANANIAKRFDVAASYGYTNAKFIEYKTGSDEGTVSYAGNFIPYIPQHTLFTEVSYKQPLNLAWANSVRFSVNNSGTGKIYWNEDNILTQPFYSLLGASVRVENRDYALTFWARNILNKEYNTFYFISMEREFVQSGLPRTIGATLTINL